MEDSGNINVVTGSYNNSEKSDICHFDEFQNVKKDEIDSLAQSPGTPMILDPREIENPNASSNSDGKCIEECVENVGVEVRNVQTCKEENLNDQDLVLNSTNGEILTESCAIKKEQSDLTKSNDELENKGTMVNTTALNSSVLASETSSNEQVDNAMGEIIVDNGDKKICDTMVEVDTENILVDDSDTEGNNNTAAVDTMSRNLSLKNDGRKDSSSLKLLCDYGSDSDDENSKECIDIQVSNSSETSAPVVNPCPAVQQDYRESEMIVHSSSEDEETDSSEEETSSSSSATSSSSSDESEDESASSSDNECVVVEEKKKQNGKVPKTRGELGLEDLPPIEDLHISVPEDQCFEIGKVLNIVDSLVVVQSVKGLPALDLDSVLFVDHGRKALGEVFDVFGKVGEPCYCVRFNSKDHAVEKGVEVGMPVFYAPRTEHSKFVFVSDLMKMKGSDASWEHNNEPPKKFLDYSDDEEERTARRGPRKTPTREVEADATQPQSKKVHHWRSLEPRWGPPKGASNREGPSKPWSTPFNRHPLAPSSRPASHQPLIRPSSFGGPLPQSHFHNAAAGAPPMPPSPWAVPPPNMRGDFNYNRQQPPFGNNQMQPRAFNNTGSVPPFNQVRPSGFNPGNVQQAPFVRPSGFNMNAGGFGQPPPRPPPPPPTYSSQNYVMPTSDPNSQLFSNQLHNRREPYGMPNQVFGSTPPHPHPPQHQGW